MAMKRIQFIAAISALLGALSAVAQLEVEVRLESYNNDDHEACEGGHCGGFAPILEGECDNMFTFCVRQVDSSSCLSIESTGDISKDTLTFSQSDLEMLGLSSNTIRFSNLPLMTQLELIVTVTDVDTTSSDDEVDEFVISLNQPINGMFGPSTNYMGTCGTGTSIELSIKISNQGQPPTNPTPTTPPPTNSQPTNSGSSSLLVVPQTVTAVSIIAVTALLF